MKEKSSEISTQSYTIAGMFTLALRIVAGWTYFSAFWRRLILENKLDPDAVGYVGEKFNHFLPHALGIRSLIEYLVTNPDALLWFMWIFTIIEAIVGLTFMLGLLTRLMSIAVFSLALGILLGAGWLGTTCLDEWQIGVLGIAAGFTIFLSGGGRYSLDYFVSVNSEKGKWLTWTSSAALPLSEKTLRICTVTGTIIIVITTLFTNQYFHGGLWGDLHNLSVRPNVEINNVQLKEQELSFTVFRNEGADVYGSFLIGISLIDEKVKTILNKNALDLSNFPIALIENNYVAKVKPGKHSLIIPLGAKATLRFRENTLKDLPKGTYELKLFDVSGITWVEKITL